MFRSGVFALTLAAALRSAAALAKPLPVEELKPYTPWNVDWDKSSCVLQRGFGSKDAMFVLKFERFGPGDDLQMVLTGKQLGMNRPSRWSINYGENGYVHRIDSAMGGALEDGTPSVFVTTTTLAAVPAGPYRSPVVTPEQEAAIREISFERFRGKRLVLKTGSLGPAMASLRKCTDQLLVGWGLDPAQQGQLQRPPVPKSSPGNWLRSEDYPGRALFRGGQSIVNFRLTVDAVGVPAACEVQRSYSGEDFDKVTCDNLRRRARFEPALDSTGQPVASYYRSAVRWVIP